MRSIKLNLELSVPDTSSVMDVTALLAAFRFVLRGFFPEAKLSSELPIPKARKSSRVVTAQHVM